VDASGRLLGINSAIYGCGGNVGIGFAIPSKLARQIIVRLAEEGKVNRGFFGLQLEEVDADAASAAKLDRIRGAKVSGVMEGGAFATGGLKVGDVILKAGDREIETRAVLRLVLSMVKPGGTVPIEFSRAGERRSVSITARDNPDAKDTGTFELASLPGVKFRVGANSLVVASVSPEVARKTQIEAGMQIVEINGEATENATAVESALRRGVNKVKTRTDDGERTLAVRVD
jgi:S1-C subfamily serine protease